MNVNQIFTLGSHGDDVMLMQQVIQNKGYLTRQYVNGLFNQKTLDAIKAFQKDNNLVADGVCGPITLSRLFPVDANKAATKSMATDDVLRAKFIEVAYKYLGVKEITENSSPYIDRWLAGVGIDFPAPWCMAFVQGTGKEACSLLGFPDLLKPDTGGVLDFYERTKSQKVGVLEGRRGDIMIMDHGGGNGHTGWVISLTNGVYETIEGNSNAAGSRDSDSVVINHRKYNTPQLKGFIRISSNGVEKK